MSSCRGGFRCLTCGLLVTAVLLIRPMSHAQAGGYSPEQARARMVLPEGFSVQVFASEPMIRQPVAACFDERGRVWVIEYLQYPNPAGLKPVTVDQYLRTEYDRVPPPPPHGPRGADRIKILEDTDGDGHADKVTTFAEGLNLASGIAVGHGGVFVGQAPYLLFYPDVNHDDRPDGDPEVLLLGFGLQDAHATVNSMMWGPDGWLYGAQGSTVTARIRGHEFQQGIWRYHPQTKAFELFAEGGGNTWGLDFDRAGNAFGSSNGAFITFHMVQGGYYWKGFAKHGPLHNPRTYGYFNSVEYHGNKLGGHVTPGGIIYKGDTFPEEFRGAFIGGNLLANAVYWHKLDRKGSTFTARHGGTLIDSRDSWFRPIDLLTGPDGSVYVVDWYDQRASHLDPRDNWDRTNGRIYKVTYKGTPRVEPFDLAKLSSEELVNLRNRVNDWWPDMARRLLAERRDPRVIPPLKDLIAADRDEAAALRDLWALHASGGFDHSYAVTLLDHPVAGVRRWSVRLIGDDVSGSLPESTLAKFEALAETDPDPMVRSQLASTCQRLRHEEALSILKRLAARSEDRNDTHVPLLIWWGVEKAMQTSPALVVEALGSPSSQSIPIIRDFVLERMARALASGPDDAADFAACAKLLENAPSEAETSRLIAGMEKGLEGRRLSRVPASLESALDKLWSNPRPSLTLVRFAVRLGSTSALARASQLAGNAMRNESERVALIELLGQVGRPETRAELLGMLKSSQSESIHLAVLNALGQLGGPDVGEALLARYPDLPGRLRDRVIDLLCSRREWASKLLDAMATGRVVAKDVRPAQVLQIVQLKDPDLIHRVGQVWGKVPASNSADKAKRIAEVRGMLPEGDKGNAARGRVVFKENCAGCHRLFGEGETIAPELTGAERGNLDFLLTSLVDPSALIRKEYQAQTIATTDGRVLTGLVLDENDKTLTLFDSKQQRTVIPRDQVEERKASEASLMPEGLLDTLREDQIRDLFRYLQSSGPPAR